MRVWVYFGLAVAGLGGMAGLYWFGQHLNGEWTAQVLATHCRFPPPIPDLRLANWSAFGLSVLALAGFVSGTVRATRGPGTVALTWLPVGVVAIVIAALCVGFAALLALSTVPPTDPSTGLDGSGLPCGEG